MRSSTVSEDRSQTSPTSRRWLIMVLLCAAQFMVVLDFSIVNVALPSIQRDLGFSTSLLQWAISGYSLTFGGFLLLGGRAADLFGRRRLFIAGLILFSLASLAGGLATSATWLIVARAFQGLGAAFISPISLSLVTTTFAEGRERNTALGVVGAVASSGFTAGVILGGLLTARLGWRWVMFVNVPIGIAVVILTPLLLRESKTHDAAQHLDLAGAATVTGGLISLVYAISEGNSVGWLSLQTLGLLLIAVVLLVAFVLVESRSRTPLVRLSIFRSRTLTVANLMSMLGPGSFGSVIFLLTLYMQEVLGYSALATGLAFLPLALLLIVMTNVSSRLVTWIGVKRMFIGGMFVLALGFLLLITISAVGNYLGLLPGLIVVALGIGPIFSTMTIAATAGVSDSEQGMASGLLNTTTQVGSGLGLAIVAAISAAVSAPLLQDGTSARAVAVTVGLRGGLVACICFAVFGLLIVLFVMRSQSTVPTTQNNQSLN